MFHDHPLLSSLTSLQPSSAILAFVASASRQGPAAAPAASSLDSPHTREHSSRSLALSLTHLRSLGQPRAAEFICRRLSLSPLSPRPLTAISASQSCALRSAKACGLSAAPRSLPHLTALSSQRSTAAWPANRNQRRNSSVTSAVRPAVGDTCPCQVDHSR